MKTNNLFSVKTIFVAFFALMLNAQVIFAQDALTSVKINVQDITLSKDAKTISYDVYLQNVNSGDTAVAVPGYLFRMVVPQADLGTNAKTVTVTNATTELGATAPTMTVSGTNWLMKFQSANLITSYATALLISQTAPGTRIGRFNITNTDGTAFANPQSFTATYAGTTPLVKSTVSIFVPSTTTLSGHASTAQPSTNFSGLTSYSLVPSTATGINQPVALNELAYNTPYPNPTNNKFYINIGGKKEVLNVFDMNGCKVLSQLVNGKANIDISFLQHGIYIVEVNGVQTKLIKK